MKKINVLEVNNIDLPGRAFNGYNMLNEIADEELNIKQAVIIKQSDDNRVVNFMDSAILQSKYYEIMNLEDSLSIHNIFSISTPVLIHSKEYQEADIIHFHMFHNTKLSIYSLIKICSEKKVVLSLHDPWFITGRCVHFYECDKWKTGCGSCKVLDNLFPFKEDNTNMMWKLKKYVFDHINIDLVVSSKWMEDLVKQSPIFENQKNIHLIPFGIDVNKYNSVDYKSARKKYKISDDNIVLFLRAQNEFKGTEYVLESLKELNIKEKITIITCDRKGLLDSVKDKYNIIDLGYIEEEELIYAMNACDIFLMPSKGESFGMMAIEAMACGKPVIVFNNTALPSVTFTPECGFLVKNKDSHDLMLAIKKLINDPKERKKRGDLAKKLCLNNYTLEKYNNSLKKLYKEIYNKNVNNKENKIDNVKNNKELNLLFQQIKAGRINKKFNIDFSDPNIEEAIMEFNEKYYYELLKNKRVSLKHRIKYQIKKHPRLYNLLKKR